MKYHLWTIGCQMNSADSRHVGAALEALGGVPTPDPHQADVIVLNTCVVRQSAEDRAAGFLWSLKPLKERRPGLVIALMGCMVGVKGNGRLREVFPHVDVFLPPGDARGLVEWLTERAGQAHPPAPCQGEPHPPAPVESEPHPPSPSPLRGEGERSPSPLAERGLGGEVLAERGLGGEVLAERGLGGEVLAERGLGGEVLSSRDDVPLFAPIPGYVYQLARELRQQQTPAEKLLWACLRNRQLNGLKFRRQHPLGRYIADFYCPEKRVVIELEGAVHSAAHQAEYDAIRRSEIEARGLHVLRFTNAEVEARPETVLARIAAEVDRLAADPRFLRRSGLTSAKLPETGPHPAALSEPHPPAPSPRSGEGERSPSPLAERGLGGEVLAERGLGGEVLAERGLGGEVLALVSEPHPPAPSPLRGEGGRSPSLPTRKPGVSAPVAALLGCNHVCSYCIIPSRRGPERSRPLDEILTEVRSLAAAGVREVVLLGQIVDRYGYDLGATAPRLPDLLAATAAVEGIVRVRFLTSHPTYFDDRLVEAVATLPAVCEHIEVPIQAGDDEVLARMRRGYRVDDYRRLIERLRARLPGCAIATDVIVGFPGETERQFQATLDLLAELRMDVCHVAMYSPRPGTLAARTMPDDVPVEEKKRRLDAVNALQEQIAAEINARLLGQRVEILVEGRQKGRWKGRTRTNKLVFFDDDSGTDWRGRLVDVRITWTGPWSLIGDVVAA